MINAIKHGDAVNYAKLKSPTTALLSFYGYAPDTAMREF